jgi:hypothetical protein
MVILPCISTVSHIWYTKCILGFFAPGHVARPYVRTHSGTFEAGPPAPARSDRQYIHVFRHSRGGKGSSSSRWGPLRSLAPYSSPSPISPGRLRAPTWIFVYAAFTIVYTIYTR